MKHIVELIMCGGRVDELLSTDTKYFHLLIVFLAVQNVEKLKFPSSRFNGVPKSPVVGMRSSSSSVSVRPNSDTDMYEANRETAFIPKICS